MFVETVWQTLTLQNKLDKKHNVKFACCSTCGDPESFARGGPTQTFVFLDNEGERSQIPLKVGDNISMAFHWHADDGQTLHAGSPHAQHMNFLGKIGDPDQTASIQRPFTD